MRVLRKRLSDFKFMAHKFMAHPTHVHGMRQVFHLKN
jgi:hypothetical protein